MTEPTRRTTKKAAAPPAPKPVPISPGQMRHLHGLLRSRLGVSERQDVLDALSVTLDRDVTTRRDLTYHDADVAFSVLEPMEPLGPTSAEFAALRVPFAEEAIGRLPRSTCRACSQAQNKRCEQHNWISRCDVCNGRHSSATMHIDYVGHADVTARLLAVDPHWTWEPMALDVATGMPMLDRSNGLWIRLTVLGVTRPGYGDAENGKGMKEAIGDALRNAAMRFGVALDLWAKGDREWAHAPKDGTDQHPDAAAPAEDTAPEWTGPTVAQSLARLDAAAASIGFNREQVTAKWREARHLTVADLAKAPPGQLHALADQVEAHVATMAKAAAAEEATTAEPGNTGEQPPEGNPWA